MKPVMEVVEAHVIELGSFNVKLSDGLEGIVRFVESDYRGVFGKLRDPIEFSKLYVNDGVVTWPGELDLDPCSMHELIKEQGECLIR